jgi:hypothetical protein
LFSTLSKKLACFHLKKDVKKLNHGEGQYFTIIADPRCLSQIPDPDFYPPWISDPRKATKGGVWP